MSGHHVSSVPRSDLGRVRSTGAYVPLRISRSYSGKYRPMSGSANDLRIDSLRSRFSRNSKLQRTRTSGVPPLVVRRWKSSRVSVTECWVWLPASATTMWQSQPFAAVTQLTSMSAMIGALGQAAGQDVGERFAEPAHGRAVRVVVG